MEIWDYLLSEGWVERGGVLVRFSHPRLGFKRDGTLIVGYFEHPEKITSIEQLNEIINDKGGSTD